MMPPFNSIFPDSIIAYTSDRSVDFTLDDDRGALTDEQKHFLISQLHCNLPDPAQIRQAHGDVILVADHEFPHRGTALEEADGLITQARRLPLTVRSADCLPVFLYDETHGGIGLIHVGWKGSHKNIIGKAIELMGSEWQADASEIKAYFGPSICSCCYEVGSEFSDLFPGELIARDGRYYLDLPEINRSRLMHAGVPDDHIVESGICTCCDKNYFSHRRDKGQAGRMLSLIVMNN